jgi:hypothetical protein
MEEKSRGHAEHVQVSQPRTHCLRCGERLTKRQRQEGNRYCGRDCLALAEGWKRTPKEAQCTYCGKALNYEQRKNGARYCEIGHANKHRRWPSQAAEWAEANEYLETRDAWERIAPRMTAPPESQKDWQIQQIMREETRRWGHR